MTLRVGKINGVSNQNQDKDYSAADLLLLADSAVISGLAVTTGSVAAGRAVVKCVRTSTTPSETIFVHVENTTASSIDTTGTKKVWIEVQQANINTAASNTNADGSGIAVINTGANYPAGNYVPLASITGGVITDERQYLKINAFENAGIQKGKKSTDIASATTTDLATANGNYVHITGTTTITALGTMPAGTQMTVVFDGILTLTHNATSLKLPTGLNITTQAGDAAIFESEGSGNWKCVSYLRADGQAVGATLPSIPTLQKTFVAGENISAGDAVYTNYYRDSTIAQLTGSPFYDGGGHTHGQTINTTGLKTLVDVVGYFYWASNASVNITLQIYDTPGGTQLWNSGAQYMYQSGGVSASMTFSPNLDVSGRSSIYLLFSDDQPYVNNEFNTSDVYAGGQRYLDGSPASGDLKFSLTVLADGEGKVYKTDASNRFRKNFLGFAVETITAGNNIRINTDGVSNNLTSLVSGSTYFTTATPGAISITPSGAYSVAVGKATSATNISIDFEETTLKVSDSELAKSASTASVFNQTSYTKAKEIKVMKSGIYRISFGIWSDSGGLTVYGRIYVNGVAVGTERSTSSNSEVTYTEDISANAGDLVQIYIKHGSSSHTVYTANFTVKGSIFSTSFAPIVNI